MIMNNDFFTHQPQNHHFQPTNLKNLNPYYIQKFQIFFDWREKSEEKSIKIPKFWE